MKKIRKKSNIQLHITNYNIGSTLCQVYNSELDGVIDEIRQLEKVDDIAHIVRLIN